MEEVRLPASSFEEMGQRSEDEHPNESCGIVLGREEDGLLRVTRVLPATNLASDRRHRFVIDPRIVLRLQRELRGTGESIAGFYH
jgi:proteasome lid subunit RPN8/RPN11